MAERSDLYSQFMVDYNTNEGPYEDRPPLCPFRLLPLPTCS